MLILEITNDKTGSEKSANYIYRVFINSEVVWTGRIEGHNSEDGFVELLRLVYHDCRAACKDCGISYDGHRDVILSNEQWDMIAPEGKEIILCANCIAKRAAKLPESHFVIMELKTRDEYIEWSGGGNA